MKRRTSLLLAVALVCLARGAVADPPPTWDNWRSLLGNWEAEGKGTPGSGVGKFSFALDLQNRVIVRKSHTDYPPAEGRAAFSHDDLMIVYREEGSDRTRADYFDNEGHVIRYTAEVSPDSKTVTFVSDPQPSQPVFRLTYNLGDDGRLAIKFEIAPPTAPKQFKVYVEGSAYKSEKKALWPQGI
jgi:hypothetical protein